jgi:hypothetical protein
VTSRFDTIELERTGPDRVLVHKTKGEPPPSTLKVAMNEMGGFRNDVAIVMTGLDIEEKAALLDEAFWIACPFEPEDFASVKRQVIRSDHDDPESNETAGALWKVTVKDPDERKVGRAFSNALTEIGLASIPGLYGVGSGPSAGSPYGVYRPALVPADLVPSIVHVLGGETTIVDSVAPAAEVVVEATPGPVVGAPGGPTEHVPFGKVVGTRSGDKGGNANLGVFARSDNAWAWLDGFLTTDKLRELLPEAAELEIDRYRLASIRSLNFLIHGLLEEGVASSTRQDGQAKSLGEWLRARHVDIPIALL